MAEVDAQPKGAPGPPLTPAVALAGLAFLVWMWGGYALLLSRVGRRPFATASWQAVTCLLAIPILLFIVVKFIALPKPYVNRLPRVIVEALWLLGLLFEVLFPWVGWTTLLWGLHGGSWGAAAIPAAVIALFSYLTGFLILAFFHPGPRSVRFTEFALPIAGLPEEFEGYRILHLSDLHVNAYNPPAQARLRLARAAEVEADLVAYTGDLTDNPKCLEDAADILATVMRPDGIFAVMGNHDNWQGAAEVAATLKEHGITPLVNARHTIARGRAELHLVGVDNLAYSERDDLASAMEGTGKDETIILLSHAPEVILRPGSRRAALILCGHTHGGQIVLPLLGAFYIPSKLGRHYASGLFRLDHTYLYITRGLGEIFPPLRLLCPPEVAVITLRAA